MFNFLFALGSGLILLGIVNKRKQLSEEQPEVQVSHPAAKTFESEELMNRMEQLEQLVFQSLLRQEEAKAEEPAEQVPEPKAAAPEEPSVAEAADARQRKRNIGIREPGAQHTGDRQYHTNEQRGGFIIKKLIQALFKIKSEVLISLGAGILIGAIAMNITFMAGINYKVEEKARALGMVYPDEIHVLSDEEGKQ